MDVSSEMMKDLKVWILSDGKTGHKNQSLGVAESLGLENVEVIELKKRLFGGVLSRLYPTWGVKNFPKAPWPDMLISTGNLTAPVSQFIKTCAPRTFVVQCMKPRRPYNLYDVIAAPAYDHLPVLSNVVYTVGAPNRITPERLKESKKHWKPTFSDLKDNKISVLIGGDSNRFAFDANKAQNLAQELKIMAEDRNASLLITTSRRTCKESESILRTELENGFNYFWDGEGENPYFGLLAYADEIVVTAESISMISEACTTGKPVYIFGAGDNLQVKGWGKFNQFFAELKAKGRIAPLGGKPPQAEAPLSDTQLVAGFIRAKFHQLRI